MVGQLRRTLESRCKPLSKKWRKKAGRVVKRKLADGTIKEYRYGAYEPPGPKIAPDSLNALIRAWRNSPEWTVFADHSRQVYNIYLRPLEDIGHIAAVDMKRRELLTIRNQIAADRGNGAGNGFIRAAGSLFRWAIENEWVEYSPVHKVKLLPGGELRAWKREEAVTAQERLPEHLRRVVVLALYTGQRRGDLVAMKWSAFEGESVSVRQEKTGAELVIACHPALQAELEIWKAEIMPGNVIALPTSGIADWPILTNATGRPWTVDHLSRDLRIQVAAIGLPAGLNVHGLRKLAAAELAEAGCSSKEIAAVTGHATLAMVEFYTKSADQERLAKAAIVKLTDRKSSENTIGDKRAKTQTRTIRRSTWR
jgi:integrase